MYYTLFNFEISANLLPTRYKYFNLDKLYNPFGILVNSLFFYFVCLHLSSLWCQSYLHRDTRRTLHVKKINPQLYYLSLMLKKIKTNLLKKFKIFFIDLFIISIKPSVSIAVKFLTIFMNSVIFCFAIS